MWQKGLTVRAKSPPGTGAHRAHVPARNRASSNQAVPPVAWKPTRSTTVIPGTVRAWAGCPRRASVNLPPASKRAGTSVENQGLAPPLLSVARIGGNDAHDESVTAHHHGMADLVDPRRRARVCARSGRVSHAPLRTLARQEEDAPPGRPRRRLATTPAETARGDGPDQIPGVRLSLALSATLLAHVPHNETRAAHCRALDGRRRSPSRPAPFTTTRRSPPSTRARDRHPGRRLTGGMPVRRRWPLDTSAAAAIISPVSEAWGSTDTLRYRLSPKQWGGVPARRHPRGGREGPIRPIVTVVKQPGAPRGGC